MLPMGQADSRDTRIMMAAAVGSNTAAQIEYWKHGINVSMHFNDMCIRLRILCLTVLATFFAGAAVSMAQYPNGVVSIFAQHVHISAALYTIALIFVSSLWLLDQGYYYKMLIASVENSEHVEPKVKALVYNLVEDETLTQKLTATIPRAASRSIANVFYGAQVGICALMLVSALAYGHERQIASAIALQPSGAEANMRAPSDDLRGRGRAQP
jgi:hypothetical protein